MTTALSKSLATGRVRQIVGSVKARGGQLTAQHVGAILARASHGQSGKSLPLPGGVEVRRERDTLVFLTGTNFTGKSGEEKTAPREFSHHIDLARTETTVSVPRLGCTFRLRAINFPVQSDETSQTRRVPDR